MTVYTVGHSTRSQDDLIALLQSAGVTHLVDVRSWPRSRRNPQFNGDALEHVLGQAGIGYRHMKALGGRRGPQADAGPSANTAWQESAFRHYADYALSATFRTAIETLRALAREETIAIMCAEADWARCHRQIIADYLLAGGETVMHIVDRDRTEPAHLNSRAIMQSDGSLHYPAEQGDLFG